MVRDSIANLINGLLNASKAKKNSLSIPHSKVIANICEVLKKEQYIEDFKVTDKKGKKDIEITLKFDEEVPAVTGAKRVSKQSQRLYSDAKSLKPVKNGYGIMVISTPKGIMTGKEAKKLNVGGETLFIMW